MCIFVKYKTKEEFNFTNCEAIRKCEQFQFNNSKVDILAIIYSTFIIIRVSVLKITFPKYFCFKVISSNWDRQLCESSQKTQISKNRSKQPSQYNFPFLCKLFRGFWRVSNINKWGFIILCVFFKLTFKWQKYEYFQF